ncbi:MAG: hypothetical protein WCA35_21365 [Kovacikia sp.]
MNLATGDDFGFTEGTRLGKFPVESYADRLMDELFEDVEEMLGGSPKPQVEPEPVKEEPAPAQTPAQGFFGLSPSTRFSKPNPETVESGSDFGLSQRHEQLAESNLEKAPPLVEKPLQPRLSYERILLGVGCLSIVVTMGLWFLLQQVNRQSASISASSQTTASSSSPVGDPFATYMQRSLQAIDQKNRPAVSTRTATNSPSPAALPTVTIPGSPVPSIASVPSIPGVPTLGASPQAPSGQGRIYIPVYQVPSGLTTPQTAPAPTVAPLPAISPKTGSTAVRPPIPLSVPGVARTLEGVVDMGEQSAILVKINGVTQRFRLGESIGSSGWALVEVSKNQAIVRRNGEVRSLFIGQSF